MFTKSSFKLESNFGKHFGIYSLQSSCRKSNTEEIKLSLVILVAIKRKIILTCWLYSVQEKSSKSSKKFQLPVQSSHLKTRIIQ